MLSGSLASASPAAVQFDLPSQDLADELSLFARVGGIELLFDRSLVAHRRGPAVHGVLTPAQALARLLAGSDLVFHATSDGAFVISAGEARHAFALAPTTQPAPDVGAVAEIMVTGHRSLNADIPRSPDDIQPYAVAGAKVISQSQAENVEDFLRIWFTADAEQATLAQAPVYNNASVRSQIDLRGLGPDQTLVLVDGRRLPSIPTSDDFAQPDVNGIPLFAIERVETLTSTAGGIFGPGATGGVVNVVLKRDYTGGELSITSGETTRGDAAQWRANGAFGVSNPATGTSAMLAFTYGEDSGLTLGSRSSLIGQDVARYENAVLFQIIPPVSNTVNISSGNGLPLTFIPSLGGQSLGATITHTPLSVGSGSSVDVAQLRANAGAFDLSLSPDGQGAQQSLLAASRTESLILSLRQALGVNLVAFVDFLYLNDTGKSAGPIFNEEGELLSPGQGGNPFQNPVFVSFPTAGFVGEMSNTTLTERATAGLIARLPHGWTAEFDLASGSATVREETPDPAVLFGVSPFLGSSALAAALAGYRVNPTFFEKADDSLLDANLRLAGSPFKLPGGAFTLTVSGEIRRERSLGPIYFVQGQEEETGEVTPTATEQVGSVYTEARAPLLPANFWVIPLRGLELQLALRGDRYAIGIPGSDAPGMQPKVSARDGTISVTAGAQVFPVPGVMFRASFADGYLPPTPTEIVPNIQSFFELEPLVDPRRGGQLVASEGNLVDDYGGSPSLRPELARTVSVGGVLNPVWVKGLRASIDYTRTEKSDEIANLTDGLNQQNILDQESSYPGRIVRAPLTPADAAKGFTGGVITAIDTGYLNGGRTVVDEVDFTVTYETVTAVGAFRFGVRASWEPSLRHSDGPALPFYELAGEGDGPIVWRGNASLDWERGAWSASLRSQIYGSYRVAVGESGEELQSLNPFLVKEQEGESIPAQFYLDASIGYRCQVRFAGSGRTIEYRLGIRNIFDAQPPISAQVGAPPQFSSVEVGYSPYGDPRGRRFEFTATAHF